METISKKTENCCQPTFDVGDEDSFSKTFFLFHIRFKLVSLNGQFWLFFIAFFPAFELSIHTKLVITRIMYELKARKLKKAVKSQDYNLVSHTTYVVCDNFIQEWRD